MGLLDLWDYVRSSGDARLRKQGYASSGMGILERYRRATAYWEPHLANNRRALLAIAERLGSECGGTLLVLGAGRLLDVPWEQLFPRFERVALFDADFTIVPYVERLVAARAPALPKPVFEIGDLTGSVVDVAMWAAHTIQSPDSPAKTVEALGKGFAEADAPPAPWTRAFADVRLVISTNLLSQLGHFPRQHVEEEFKRRFRTAFSAGSQYASGVENMERYFGRVRARHILDLAGMSRAWAYLSSDIEVLRYTAESAAVRAAAPPAVELDARNQAAFAFPAEIVERNDPLHGQQIRDLWPRGAKLDPPQRWAWHILPLGCEKSTNKRGRAHVVEAWTKLPG